MSSAPVIIWIRPNVGFTPAASSSFRRVEAELGREMSTNSTYRDYDKQMGMYVAWNRWVAGTGPRPSHSRAIHPDYSIHCRGNALDTNEWTDPAFRALMARHGWIRTAAWDPTEQHHFEYQIALDQYLNGSPPDRTDDEMPTPAEIAREILDTKFLDGTTVGQTLIATKQSTLRAELASAQGTGPTSFYKHEAARLWIYVMENGDYRRIRDVETARLYKERAGRSAVVLSTDAIQMLVTDLDAAGGVDLTNTKDPE